MNDMTPRKAANRAGICLKLVRHDETIGVIAPPARQENDQYRPYGAARYPGGAALPLSTGNAGGTA